MDLRDLTLNCPHCNAWYTPTNAPEQELVEDDKGRINDVYYCNCHGNKTELKDAASYGLVTPYDEMRVEFMRSERDMLLARVDRINREITNITGTEE